MAARYKVVHEEISMHWASFKSEQPHIMHSFTTDHGGNTCSRRTQFNAESVVFFSQLLASWIIIVLLDICRVALWTCQNVAQLLKEIQATF